MARKRPAKKSVGAKAVKAGAKSRAAKKAARSGSKAPVAAKKTKAKAGKKDVTPPAKAARAAKARRTVAKKAAKKAAKSVSAKTSAKRLAKPVGKSARKASPRKLAEASTPLPAARRATPRISAGRRADSRKAAGRAALAKNTLTVRTTPARKPARKSPSKKPPAKRAVAPKKAGKTARSRLTPRATKTLAPPVLRDAARRRVVKPTALRPEKLAARVRRAPFRLHALGVRDEHPTDRPQISTLLTATFARPDETAFLEGARTKGRIVLSLVAEYDSQIIGHIAFVRVEAVVDGKIIKAAEIAALAVAPARQGRGIGSVLVGAGLEAARTAGYDAVFVADGLAYFARFGFSSPIAAAFESAGSEPLAAIDLKSGVLSGASGSLGRVDS